MSAGQQPSRSQRLPGAAADQAAPTLAGETLPEWVQTKHTWNGVDGSFPYTATAGFVGIRNPETNELEAKMFFVAYTKDDANLAKRPITFAFNGGPGSSSVWLHMGTIGPRRAKMNDDGSLPPPPFEYVDNKESWLPFTDIVMIDAIGAGYSRPMKAELGKKFYGLQGDLGAFTNCIKTYLTKASRWKSPVIVAGESYGGIRSAGLTQTLLSEGIALNGVISISGVINMQTIRNARGNDLPYIGFLPTQTAVAFYHHRLNRALMQNFDKTLAESEAFAEGEYTLALQMGDALPKDRRKKVVARLAELTGLSEKYIDRADLRVRPSEFRAELLRDQLEVIGRYDARLKGHNVDGNSNNPEFDPSDTAVTPVFTAAFNEYVQDELKFKNDEPYRTTGYAFIGAWDYGTQGGYPDTSDSLRRAITQNPHMKVMLVCGRYDLACPYFAMRFTIAHLGEEEKLKDNIRFLYFPAGHMMYIDTESRKLLAKDVEGFVMDATNARP